MEMEKRGERCDSTQPMSTMGHESRGKERSLFEHGRVQKSRKDPSPAQLGSSRKGGGSGNSSYLAHAIQKTRSSDSVVQIVWFTPSE